MSGSSFDPIKPGEIDYFLFDFTKEIGATGAITAADWTCVVSPRSLIIDPDPTSRIVDTPTHDSYKTRAPIGNMVAGVIYSISAEVTLDDGRELAASQDLECEPPPAVLPILAPGVARFDYTSFITMFPEFGSIDSEVAQSAFDTATLFHRNDGLGPVQDPGAQARLLFMLAAHILKLFSPVAGKSPQSLVGRINSMSVGPISAGAEGFTGVVGSQQWLIQTSYGTLYWAATAAYRTMRVRLGPRRFFNPVYGPGMRWLR